MSTPTSVRLREVSEEDGETFCALRKVYWDQTFRPLSGDGPADRYLRFEKP